MAIIHGILKGERDARVLAALADAQVKASKEVIAKSLEGNWRQELLFVLAQEVELYGVYQDRSPNVTASCRPSCGPWREGGPGIQSLGSSSEGEEGARNAPKFDLRTNCIGSRA